MRTIDDLLSEAWKSHFVGRNRELERMRRITDGSSAWQLLHVYGPLGIGKTSLLKRFGEMQYGGKPVLYIDGHRDGFEQPDAFMDQLAEQLETKAIADGKLSVAEVTALLSKLADEAGGVVLLLDGLDRCRPIEEWLREQFLPKLSSQINVFTAGRLPLGGSWLTASGWTGLAANVPLPPLRKEEWLQYTSSVGITDFRQLDAIGRLAAGIPLALSIACQAIRQRSVDEYRSPSWLRSVSQDMETALFQDSRLSATNLGLLPAASLFYRFDQELLEEVLDRRLDDDEFRDFCKTAYISVKAPNGWTVVDGFRHWLRNNLKERKPETYKELQRRAWTALERRLGSARGTGDGQELELWFEQLYLNDNEFLHHYTVYGNDERYEVRSAAEQELPLLQQMYTDSFASLSPYMNDDTHQEQYLPEIWSLEPDSIHVMCRQGAIDGFHSLIPLNERTRAVFARNPMTQPYIGCTEPEPDEYLFWIGATRSPMDPEVIGYMTRHIFFPTVRGKLATIIIPMPDVVEAYRYFGFKRIPWAEWRSPGGLHFYAARLDWRSASIDSEGRPSSKGHPYNLLNEEDRILLIKQALGQYQALKRGRELDCGNNPQLRLRPSRGWPELLEEGLRSMADGTRLDRSQERVLRMVYIQKAGSHEAAASRLDLPLSTYFRYLKNGLKRLAACIEELSAEWE